MGIFKANDIRGIFPHELDRERIWRIGFYLSTILKTDSILVGRDTRNSSDEVFELLTKGILDSGANVSDIGICDTPAVYFATVNYGYHGSVMITASHNPPEYNGLKISATSAVPIGPEDGLKHLKTLITKAPVVSQLPGNLVFLDIGADYVGHVRRFLGEPSPLKVVFDCGHGAASTFVHDIFGEHFSESKYLFDKPDGNFPDHGPNPLEHESWTHISNIIREENANLGVLFDGDADRAIFFDESGNFISPDIITAVIGRYYYGIRKSKKPMFYDIRSSKSVAEYISSLGGRSSACVTGHANIKRHLKLQDGVFAGELSGHYYFSENFYCDSGFIAVAIVCEVLSQSGGSLSEIVRDINPYFFSGEKNFSVGSTENVLDGVKKHYSEGILNEIDGIRIDYKDWWFNLRPSGAEPLLRLVVEADAAQIMVDKVNEISTLIASVDI